MRRIALCLALAASVPAQAQFDVVVRKPGADHVRRLMDSKEFRIAREVALQCARDSNDAWCKFYAAQLLFDGLGGPRDDEQAFDLVKASAEQENPAAQAFYGNMHFKGIGVDKNERLALSWWERSARNCNTWAQNGVARTYYDGEWVRKDVARAYYWISLAAYYEFPDAERGIEVVGEELSAEQVAAVKRSAFASLPWALPSCRSAITRTSASTFSPSSSW